MAAQDSEKAQKNPLPDLEPAGNEKNESSWTLLKRLTRKPEDALTSPAAPSAVEAVETAESNEAENEAAIETDVAPNVASPTSIRYAQSIERVEQMTAERLARAATEQNRTLSRQAKSPSSLKSGHSGMSAILRSRQALLGVGVAAVVVVAGAAMLLLGPMSSSHSVADVLKFLDENKFDKALEAANAAVNANPNDANAYFARGKVFQQLKVYKESLADYEKGLSLQKPDRKTLIDIGQVYLACEENQKALDLYDELLSSKTPTPDASAYAGRAYAYVKLGQYQRGIDDYEQAIRMNAKESNFLAGDAYAYSQMKKYVQAISIYTAALALQPNNLDALLHRAWCRWQLGHDASALDDLRKATKLAPQSGLPLYFEARYWFDHKQPAKGMDKLNKSIALDPKCVESLQMRGDIFYKDRDWNKAYADYAALGQAGASSDKYWNTFADLAVKVGKQDQANRAYSVLISKSPNNLKALAGRAKALVDLGKNKEALADCNAVLAIAPNNSQALCVRGLCEEAVGNSISALNDYVSALKCDDKNAVAHVKRGNFYLKDKDFISASNEYDKALAVNPNLAEAVSNRKVAMAEVKKMSVVRIDRESGTVRISSSFSPKVLASMDTKGLLAEGYKRLSAGKTVDAIALLQEFVTRNPGDAAGRRYLAHALAQAEQYAAALQQFEALASLGPLQHFDEVTQADCYRGAGNFDKAIGSYLSILVAHPADGKVLVGLAKAYAMSGQTDKAMKVCEDAMRTPAAGAVRDYYSTLRTQATQSTVDSTGKKIDIGG